MPEYTKRLVERLAGRPMDQAIVPRPAWPFGRSDDPQDPFEAARAVPADPWAPGAVDLPRPRPERPFEPSSLAAPLPARAPALLEPRPGPAPAAGPPSSAPRAADRGAHEAQIPGHRREDTGAGDSSNASEGAGARPPVPPVPTTPRPEARVAPRVDSSLALRVSALERGDRDRIEAAPPSPALPVQREGRAADRETHESSARNGPDRLAPPPVTIPPTAPAEPRVVIGRVLVEVMTPPAPAARTPPPPAPPTPPRPFRAGTPSSALFRRPLGLGQG